MRLQMSKYYGEHISPVLKEIHDTLWEIDARELNEPYEYSPEALPAASKIFMSVCMDRLWLNQNKSDAPIEDRLAQAENMGEDLRQFMIKHLGVDPKDFYGKKD